MRPPIDPRARAAGALYLTTHVTSVLAVLAYARGAIVAGITLEFALAIGCVGTGTVLWVLLRDHGPTRAATFALLRTVEAAVILAGTLPMATLLRLEQDGALDAHPGASGVLDGLHTGSFLIGQGLVIAVNTVVLGWLLLDSGAVPRPLALLGLSGGVLVLISDLAQLWAVIPANGALAGLAAVPVFAFEIWLALRLLLTGLGPRVAIRSNA